MIGAREAAAAHGALEGFGSRVFPEVTRQLIGTSEPPVTALPRAPIRLLTSVCPQMSFQVGRLGVNFLTTWKITVVYPSFLEVWVCSSVVTDRH